MKTLIIRNGTIPNGRIGIIIKICGALAIDSTIYRLRKFWRNRYYSYYFELVDKWFEFTGKM